MKTPNQIIADREAEKKAHESYIQAEAEKHIDLSLKENFNGESAIVNLRFQPRLTFLRIHLVEDGMETLRNYLDDWRVFQNRGRLVFIRKDMEPSLFDTTFKKLMKQSTWSEIHRQ